MEVINTLKKYDMLKGAEHVLCALSGGADSVAMTHFLALNAKALGITVSAAHFSHGIRTDAAQPERELCERLCRRLGIRLYCGQGDTPSVSREKGESLELAARSLRYEFLEDTARLLSGAKIATAHHLSDNAETVIMNMIRGAGLAGLAGIPPVRDNIIRPLIETSKEEIERYIAHNNLEYATDLTNFEDCCRRNSIRLNILPHLTAEEPAAIKNIGRLSCLAREMHSGITREAEEMAKSCLCTAGEVSAKVSCFTESRRDVAARLVELLHKEAGGKTMLTSKHINAVLEICESASPSKSADIPQMTVHREYENIVFAAKKKDLTFESFEINEGETVSKNGWEVSVSPGREREAFVLDKSKISLPLKVRARKEGDTLFYNGMTKSLKKLMIEKKIPKEMRDMIPVLCDNNRVIAVAELGCDLRVTAKTDENAVCVKIGRVQI